MTACGSPMALLCWIEPLGEESVGGCIGPRLRHACLSLGLRDGADRTKLAQGLFFPPRQRSGQGGALVPMTRDPSQISTSDLHTDARFLETGFDGG